MNPVRRMRRFADRQGNQYDELPNGLLRRRLRRGERHRGYPAPKTRPEIEAAVGSLEETGTKGRR
jgi:hypothetical protein